MANKPLGVGRVQLYTSEVPKDGLMEQILVIQPKILGHGSKRRYIIFNDLW